MSPADGPELQIRKQRRLRSPARGSPPAWLRHDASPPPRPAGTPLGADLHRLSTLGGAARSGPRKLPTTSASRARVTPVQGDVATIVPWRRRCRSCTRADDALIRLRHPAANGASRVRAPTTIQQSLANGSSVPRCPTRSSPSARRTMSTTSWTWAGRLGDQQQPTVAQSSVSFSSFKRGRCVRVLDAAIQMEVQLPDWCAAAARSRGCARR